LVGQSKQKTFWKPINQTNYSLIIDRYPKLIYRMFGGGGGGGGSGRGGGPGGGRGGGGRGGGGARRRK
jgi:hypothetical protein